jgi:hypothetical protein
MRVTSIVLVVVLLYASTANCRTPNRGRVGSANIVFSSDCDRNRPLAFGVVRKLLSGAAYTHGAMSPSPDTTGASPP